MPNSVFIAGIIGFVVGVATNLMMAIFCGLFFALIMWSITGFRIDRKNSDNKNIRKPAPPSQPESDPLNSNISPRELGVGLAISLDTSCNQSLISSVEQDLLQQVNVPLSKYHQELLVLCASAQECAILNVIKNENTRRSVLDGYREAWNNVSSSGSTGSALYRLFSQRRAIYIAAYFEDKKIVRNKNEVLASSRLSLAFIDSIDSTGENPSKSGILFMLAAISADAYFGAHFEGSVDAIKRAKLI